MTTRVINARIDSKLKKDTEAILARIGLTSSEFIRLCYTQVRNKRSIPFTLDADMDETEYLLSTPENKKHLEESIEQANRGELYDVKLLDV